MQINRLKLQPAIYNLPRKNKTPRNSIAFKGNLLAPQKNINKIPLSKTARKLIQSLTVLKYTISDFLYDVSDAFHKNVKKQEITLRGKERILKISNDTNYTLFSKEGKKLAQMNVAYDNMEQILCEDDFYRNAKKGSLSISSLLSNTPGAGSFFVEEAVKKSNKMGLNGRVIVYALDIEPERGTPVPFYYKKGFRAFKVDAQKKIEAGMKDFNSYGEYTGPRAALMYLPKEKIAQYLKPNCNP